MNRLYPTFWSTGFRAWPVHLGMHHAGLPVLQLTLQMQMGAAGFSLLLPGVFLSGLIFDRGSGIFAVHRRRRRARATDHSIPQLLNTLAPIRNVALPSASSALHSLFEAGGKLGGTPCRPSQT